MARMFGNHELADLIANFRQEDVVGTSPTLPKLARCRLARIPHRGIHGYMNGVAALRVLAARPFGSPQQQTYHYDDDPSIGYIPPKPPAGFKGIYPAPPDAPARRKVFAPIPPPLPPLPPTEDQQAYVWWCGPVPRWSGAMAC